MDRQLSLSQAARLIGVKRKDIQKKIQENKLRVMEGTVKLSDLKKAFPDAAYEDNTMLEKTQQIMRDAVHKMAQSERDGAQLDALSRRLFKINTELVEQRNRANHLESLIDNLKQKFLEISISSDHKTAFNEIKEWFNSEIHLLESNTTSIPAEQLNNQIKQFMLPHVRLLPSYHNFVSDKSSSLLESALRAGLAVDYGCNNGKCGKCKAKLISGEVEKIAHQDYVFSESEKNQGYILTCSTIAKTDITLETEEAVSTDDIPLQTISTKLKKIDRSNNHVIILSLKTPRSQRLRFLAGQNIELRLDSHLDTNGQVISAEYPIASCPCEARNLEFHIPVMEDEEFAHTVMQKLKNNENITIHGPNGHFVLDEDSPNSLIFVAWDTGFAAIKSLIEHALSLDRAESIHLYWMTTKAENHYMDNLCRSWNDALDHFSYKRIRCDAKTSIVADTLIQLLKKNHQNLLNNDLYIAAPGHLNQLLITHLSSQNVKVQSMHFESTFHGKEIND